MQRFTSGCSVEVNRVSACAKCYNRVYLFNSLLIMLTKIKYETPSYIGSLTTVCRSDA